MENSNELKIKKIKKWPWIGLILFIIGFLPFFIVDYEEYYVNYNKYEIIFSIGLLISLLGIIMAIVTFIIKIYLKKSVKNKKIEEDIVKEINPASIKKITVIDKEEEKELSLKVLETNGDILKIKSGVDDVGTICNMEDTTKILGLGDFDVFSRHDIYINQNNIIIEEDYYDCFYINTNDIKTIDIKVKIGNVTIEEEDEYNEEDHEYYEKNYGYKITIYTKNNNIYNDIYFGIENKDVLNGIKAIKKSNNKIVFNYEYTIFMTDKKYHSIKYNFGNVLNIIEYSVVKGGGSMEWHLSDTIEYKVNIKYDNITNCDIVTNDSNELCVTINTKNKNHYSLVFSDSKEASEFYNELKKHNNNK